MIGVMGAGAFGTALAVSLSRKGPVTLWAQDPDHVARMAETGENRRRLPGVALPHGVTVTPDIGAVAAGDAVLLAVPMQRLRGLLQAHGDALARHRLIACCKGMELGTGLGATGVIADSVPSAVPALLTGPSFAADIASGLPTALSLACADKAAGAELQAALTTPDLRLYRTADTAGAELGGALKNVIAIGCGAAMGAGLGESARAALMTRGFAEMVRAAESWGAGRETLTGLSGFGDLVLTCTSAQSRNYRLGHSLGRGEVFDPSVTVEGADTARALSDMAARQGLDLPITRAVMLLVTGQLKVSQAMDMLLSRPLKEE
jgi:glycerol-3-phosphate dehydrogenase (NAD(P)+)